MSNIDKEIDKMFKDARPLTQDELKAFGEKNREILSSPSFKDAALKDQMEHTMDKTLIHLLYDEFQSNGGQAIKKEIAAQIFNRLITNK